MRCNSAFLRFANISQSRGRCLPAPDMIERHVKSVKTRALPPIVATTERPNSVNVNAGKKPSAMKTARKPCRLNKHVQQIAPQILHRFVPNPSDGEVIFRLTVWIGLASARCLTN